MSSRGLDIQSGTIDPRLFRRVLGRFASGVTVVSTSTGTGVHAMTANAFMSGSLHPPLIVISVAKSAKIAPAIASSGAFGVSILRSEQETHSRHFSGQRDLALDPEFVEVAGIPLLAGALAAIAADVKHTYDCGDHSLVVGSVAHMQVDDHAAPLLFFGGDYSSLA